MNWRVEGLTNAKLHAEDYEDRDYRGKQRRQPNGNDLMAQWVGKLWIDDLAILEVHGE